MEVYKCESCAFNAENSAKLKLHNQRNLYSSKVTQYEKKMPSSTYNCFNCEKTFDSKDDLAGHPSDCHDQFNTIQSQAPFPTYETYSCEMCERSFDNVEGVERHMQVDYLESEASHLLEEIMFRKSTEDTQDFTLKNTSQ